MDSTMHFKPGRVPIIRVVIFLFCLIFLCQSSRADIILTSDSNATIVLSAQASPTEVFAANELQKYIRKMIKLDIPIKNDTARIDGVIFAIGKTSYAKRYTKKFDKSLISGSSDSFIIDVQDNVVVLVGGTDRGTIYSVYEFLERQGCRWFYPGKLGEVVPEKEEIPLKSRYSFLKPDFIQRSIGGGPTEGIDFEEIIDWSVKNRINWRFGFRDYLVKRDLPPEKRDVWKKRGGQLNWEWICHNFNHMISNEKYFDEHPEYFSFYKGERIKLSEKGMGGGNLCTTNSDVIRICADFIIDWFDKNPDGMVVPLWPADGVVKWCECENCSQLGGVNFATGKRGSMSRRMVTFANAVARLVKLKYPQRYILCPAYSSYIDPVPDIILESNVLLQYCLHGCYAHGVDKCDKNLDHKKKLQAWAKTTRGAIGVWEYFLIGDYGPQAITPAPLAVTYRARDTIKYLKDTGFTFYFTQARLQYWKHNPLPYYVITKLLWDSDTDFDALWDDFFEKMYGPAAEPVSRFYRLIEDTVQQGNWHPQIYADTTSPSVMIYSEEMLSKAEGYLKAAENMKLSPVMTERIELVRQVFDYIKANVTTQNLAGLDENNPWRLQRNEDHYILNADGAEISRERLAQIIQNVKDTGTYNDSFARRIFRARKRKTPLIFLENDRIKLAVVPGIGGRIVRLIDKKSGWNFFKESVGADSLKTIGDPYFVYGGYEEYIGAAFASPGWEKEFSYKLVEDDKARSIVLKLETSGYVLDRTISIAAGDSSEVTISSVLTNTSKINENIKLRVHPLINLGDNAGLCQVYLKQKDGLVKRSSIDNENGQLTVQPEGVWAVANEKLNVGLINYYDPTQAEPYICKTGDDNFTFELIGTETELAHRESLKIQHVYRVVADVEKKLGPLLKSGNIKTNIDPAGWQKKRSVKPKSGSLSFKKGQVASAADFANSPGIDYDAKYINGNAGTIEMWVSMPETLAEDENRFLLGVGNNNPGWFVCAIGPDKITFLNKNGQKPYRGIDQFYYHLSTSIPRWKPRQWYHIAFVWASVDRENSLVQIYVDGALKEERFNASLGRKFNYPLLNIGYSMIDRKKSFTGLMDELRISNYPKNAEEVKAAYNRGHEGLGLELEKGTLLLLDFNNKLEGLSNTIETLDTALIKDKVEMISNP